MNREEMIKDDFKDHEATIDQYLKFNNPDEKGIEIEVLTWKKPGTSNYMVRYLVSGNTLCVYGDLGEAVYQWSQDVTLDWISTLDLHYFKGKCQASEVGRDFKEWSREKAFDTLKHMEKEGYFNWSDIELTDGLDALYDSREWEEWLRENGSEILGEDYWDWAFSIGHVINTRCMYHFIGLKMAMEQIKLKNVE